MPYKNIPDSSSDDRRRSMRQRIAHAGRVGLSAVGIVRPRNADGTLGPRAWKRLFGFVGACLVAFVLNTMIHIVSAGTIGIPVTLGHAGSPLDEGFHVTWPFTSVAPMSIRTTDYTMAAAKGEGNRSAADDAVQVLGADGASGSVDSTVLYRLDPARGTEVYLNLGVNYVQTLIRPSTRTCIRSVFTNESMVNAATTAWHDLEAATTDCVRGKLEPRGIILEDLQLREVHLDATLQASVTAKVAAQQDAERQQFELDKANKQAEITRVNAIATADAQQILACGGTLQTVEQDGQQVVTVVPNPVDECSQAQLTPAYLQWLYIQALQGLVNSPNNSTIILPFDQNLTPLIQLPAAGSGTTVVPPDTGATVTGSTTTTTTTTTTSP